jgi:hypothetical protein
MSGLKHLLNTLFFPTVWLADYLGLFKKVIFFLSLNFIVRSSLSIIYCSEFDTYLERVDKVLYLAKEKGRNRVIDL